MSERHFMATKSIPYEIKVESKGQKRIQRKHWKAGGLVDRSAITEPNRFDALLHKGSIVELKKEDLEAAAIRYAITGKSSKTEEAAFKGVLKVGPSSVELEGGAAKGGKK